MTKFRCLFIEHSTRETLEPSRADFDLDWLPERGDYLYVQGVGWVLIRCRFMFPVSLGSDAWPFDPTGLGTPPYTIVHLVVDQLSANAHPMDAVMERADTEGWPS